MDNTRRDPVATGEWLADHLGDPDLVVADLRWYLDGRSGRTAYDGGHIPGAVFVDLDVDLADPPSTSGGRHPLPSPERFAANMSALGIGDTTRVVAYDDADGVIAARLWWMLDVLGQQALVLDGGIDAWTGPLESGSPDVAARSFTPRPWPAERVATADEVEAARHDATVIIDARSADRYANGAPVDPRPGHVPGARSAPATDNLTDGRFRSGAALTDHYGALGAHDHPVVAYCGSGVTACTDLLGLRRAGLPDGRLFVGSWSAWGADLERPAQVGADQAND
ncbi:MAG: sulfurtransferase [Acidimicrobiales bacterium]